MSIKAMVYGSLVILLCFGACLLACNGCQSEKPRASNRSDVLSPSTMRRIGTVDERYQSYNVEMLEVTGGKFWKPYGTQPATASTQPASGEAGETPAGMNPNVYAYPRSPSAPAHVTRPAPGRRSRRGDSLPTRVRSADVSRRRSS